MLIPGCTLSFLIFFLRVRRFQAAVDLPFPDFPLLLDAGTGPSISAPGSLTGGIVTGAGENSLIHSEGFLEHLLCSRH